MIDKKAINEVLVGTWAVATRVIRFYEKHGFYVVRQKEKDRLLRKYWTISKKKIKTLVLLKGGLLR